MPAKTLKGATCQEWVDSIIFAHGIVEVRAAVEGKPCHKTVKGKTDSLIDVFGKKAVQSALDSGTLD
jgi:hypothetical protein